jgi:glutathione S-transferase
MMKLYYAAHTCALASHIALEEAGAEYSTVRINFAAEEQRKPPYISPSIPKRASHRWSPRGES